MTEKEKCPFCESDNINRFNANVTIHEYVCRSCKREWRKTPASGTLLKIGGAVLTGAISLAVMFLRGHHDGGDA